MGVKLHGEKDILKALAKLEEIQSKDLWERVANVATRIVTGRTKKGVDVNGAPFAPYSKSYKKVPKNPVNLKRTGNMLNAVTGEGHKDHARVFVEESGRSDGESNLALAVAHDDGNDRVPQRHWFGISMESEIKKIYKVFEDALEQIARFWNR